jgi:CheY-like chemotaxis protein
LVSLIAFIVVLTIVATIWRRHATDKVEPRSAESSSSQSPFEEVVQRTEEARHGVPTGVPLNPQNEHFLKGYEQVGLGVALVLAIGLGSRRFAPGLAAVLMKRFNPWIAIMAPPPIVEEEFVNEFAARLQIVERGNAEIARSRQEVVVEFFESAPQKLKDLRNRFAEIGRSTDPAARQKSLSDFNTEIASLKSRVGSLELTPAWQMASSIERLVGQLAEKPANITPSTLRTVAGGLLLLNELCVPDVRMDLATNPPVRFLAVDDDPISRRAVSMSLKKVAQKPDLAEEGEAALELAGRQTYDAIFLDVEMPGLDGFEVCTKIHQIERNRLTPVVFVTGHSDFESRAKSTSSGGNDLIAKPFLSAEITLKALTLLFRARLDREKAEREGYKSQTPNPKEAPSYKSERVSSSAEVVTEQSDHQQVAKNGAPRARSDSMATAHKDEKPDSVVAKAGDTSSKQLAEAFATQTAEQLAEMQDQISALGLTDGDVKRKEILAELYVGLNVLRSEAALAGLRAICEMASALGKLISKLLVNPTLFTPSTLQAMSAAIRLLEELAPVGAEPELGKPPVRVLVVDDDPLTRRAISNALQLAFGKPDNADSGEGALALAQSKVFDVIFLDIMMPDMDGFQTCLKIRETKVNGATPIIFVTSHNDSESRNKAFDCGGNGFISKPVLPAEIFLTALTFTMRGRMGKGKGSASAEVLEEAVC